MTEGKEYYDYQCLFCMQIADRAVVTQCCATVLCNIHYEQLAQKPCPSCRADPFMVKPEMLARKEIYNVCPEFQIIVKALNGKIITLTVKELDLVKTIKQRIHEREFIPLESVYLQTGGKCLNGEMTLRESNIQKNTTINLLQRMKGGAKNWMV